MIYKKMVELPTGIETSINARLEGIIDITIDDHLKSKYIEFPNLLDPLVEAAAGSIESAAGDPVIKININ